MKTDQSMSVFWGKPIKAINRINLYRSIAENLRLLRTLTGVSQQQAVGFIHVNRSTYSCYELGESKPPLDVLCALAEYFDVNPGYLTGPKKSDPGTGFIRFYSIEINARNPPCHSNSAGSLRFFDTRILFLRYDLHSNPLRLRIRITHTTITEQK